MGLLDEGEVAPGIGPEEIAEGLGIDDGPSLESEAMTRLMEDVVKISEDAEGLSPEGWVRLEQRGWILRELHRTGTFAAAKYIEDAELAKQIGGREGMNRTLMEVDLTPSLDLAWGIYSLGDVVRALIGLATFGDGRWIDTLKVIAGSDEAPIRAFVGLILWGGGGSSPFELVESLVPGVWMRLASS